MNRLKILLFGRDGQLGWELHRTLAPLGDITAVDQEDLDLSDQTKLKTYILREKPDLIVNAAAYTNVDRAEAEPEMAFAINQDAPGVMARACEHLGAVFVHYSTDFVFNGEKGSPYTEADAVDPINIYGQSKLGGELAVSEAGAGFLVFRTSWVYSFRKPSFPLKVIEWAQTQDPLRIVTDQVGSPTWARMLALATSHVLAMHHSDLKNWMSDNSGIYHLAGAGVCSRYELAARTLELYEEITGNQRSNLQEATSGSFPAPARRPEYSGLDCSSFEHAFGFQLPAWQQTLRLAMETQFP